MHKTWSLQTDEFLDKVERKDHYLRDSNGLVYRHTFILIRRVRKKVGPHRNTDARQVSTHFFYHRTRKMISTSLCKTVNKGRVSRRTTDLTPNLTTSIVIVELIFQRPIITNIFSLYPPTSTTQELLRPLRNRLYLKGRTDLYQLYLRLKIQQVLR